MKPEDWAIELGQGIGPIRLGATRDEVKQSLASAGIELDADEDSQWLYVDAMGAELTFKKTKPPIVLEIAVEDEQARLGPMPVIGQRLHTVVDLLQVTDAETLWRMEAEDEVESATRDAPPTTPDEELLDGGTLWIPPLGLGLEMLRGQITTVFLRKPEAVPRRGIGSLTAAQRELSARKNLTKELGKPRAGASPLPGYYPRLLTLALLVAMGAVVWRAIDYQRRWNAAVVAEGEVTKVVPPPPEPFPSEYTISYADPAGMPHEVVFKRSDVYATPHVGEKIEIRYLSEAPDRPLGPARYRDVAFDEFVPWGIGVMVAFCVLQIVVPLAGLALRRISRDTQ